MTALCWSGSFDSMGSFIDRGPGADVHTHSFNPLPILQNQSIPPRRAREEAIAIEMVKNLREKVAWCQREHPVTHYYDCAEIVGKYLKLVKVRFSVSPALFFVWLGDLVGVIGANWT